MDNIITNVDGVKVKVRVYDFGDEVADRYTIVYVNKNIKDGYGVVYYPVFSCSEDPFHPLGVGMYAGDYYPHRSHMYNFGKRVKDIDSLPKKVILFLCCKYDLFLPLSSRIAHRSTYLLLTYQHNMIHLI